MVEMTDYEINRRLAEIAGVNVGEWTNPVDGTRSLEATGRQPACALKFARSLSGSRWSPLTDWRQLGPLMERERIEITKDGHEYWGAWLNDHEPAAVEKDLKRAIALAIIAAHESEQ